MRFQIIRFFFFICNLVLEKFMLGIMSYYWFNISNIILFMCMVCVYVLEESFGFLQLEFSVVLSYLIWVLRIEYGFSGRSVSIIYSSFSNIILMNSIFLSYIKNVLFYLIFLRELLIEFCFLNILDIVLDNVRVLGDCNILMVVNICIVRIFVVK